MTAGIEFTAHGARITGHPTLEQWAQSFTHALDLSVASTWVRTDLITFAEDENPYSDKHYQFYSQARISEGTKNNDKRRGKRFPYGHDLRRFQLSISVSHYDAVAVLDDTDAEIVLTEAATNGLGREWVRSKVKELLNTPDPQTVALTLVVDASGNVEPTVALPTWTWGNSYEVTLRERKAA